MPETETCRSEHSLVLKALEAW